MVLELVERQLGVVKRLLLVVAVFPCSFRPSLLLLQFLATPAGILQASLSDHPRHASRSSSFTEVFAARQLPQRSFLMISVILCSWQCIYRSSQYIYLAVYLPLPHRAILISRSSPTIFAVCLPLTSQ